MDFLHNLAKAYDYYLAVEGYTNKNLFLVALEELTNEIISIKETIDTITSQFSHDYVLTSMYNAFFRQWINNEKQFSSIYCGIDFNNAVNKTFDGKSVVSYIQSNQDLQESASLALQESYGKLSLHVDLDNKTETLGFCSR